MFGLHDALHALDKQGTPIGVSVIGAGAAGLPFVDQVEMAPGMHTLVVVDIEPERAAACLATAGIPEDRIAICDSVEEADRALAAGQRVATSKLSLSWAVRGVDVVVEATGNPDVYAISALNAIRAKKHYVTFNAEGDVAIGTILKTLADSAGVVYTGIHGDEPGIIKALYDEVSALGFTIVAAGRSDYAGGLPSWSRETVADFMKDCRFGATQQNLSMFASFCDGTKSNEELCQVANATGLAPDVRGMHGPIVPFDEYTYRMPQVMDTKENGGILSRIGVVERVLPSDVPEDNTVWNFVVARATNQFHKVFIGNYAAGTLAHPRTVEVLETDHRNVLFYTPYHYVSAQAPISVAFAAVHRQASIAPLTDALTADVLAIARKDLEVGTVLDEIGGVTTYGRIDRARVAKDGNLMPLALAQGATIVKPVAKGEAIPFDAVRLANEKAPLVLLRRLQDNLVDVR